MNAAIVLQEKDLALVVSEKTLGTLTTNAKDIKTLVEKSLPNYSIDNYNESNIDAAKKDKAMLNNTAKALNAKRLEFEREFMMPFAEFKEVVCSTCDLIKQASSAIDTVVRQSEEKAKKEKRITVDKLIAATDLSGVNPIKIFDEKWLNKTVSEKFIKSELFEISQTIKSDIGSVEAMACFGFTDVEISYAVNEYKDCLDIKSVMDRLAKLKQAKDASMAEEKASQTTESERNIALLREEEENAALAQQVAVQQQREFEEQSINAHNSTTQKYENVINTETQQPEQLTRAFKVFGTKEQIILLGEFMNNHGISFEKIEL